MPSFTEATVELLNYEQFLEFAANSLNYSGQTEMLNYISQELRSNPYKYDSLQTKEKWVEQIMADLNKNGYTVNYNGNNQWTSTAFSSQPQVTTTNPVNSNLPGVSRGSIRNFYGGVNEFNPTTGWQTWVPTRFPVSGGLGSKAMYLLGSAYYGIGAVSTGIWLGKTIDSALYNLMPDYWDSIGASTLNPETWGSIINADDSPFGGLMNFILGIDGENGNAQAYMDANALAYMAMLLNQNGWFNNDIEVTYTYDGNLLVYNSYFNQPLYGISNFTVSSENSNFIFTWTVNIPQDVTVIALVNTSGAVTFLAFCKYENRASYVIGTRTTYYKNGGGTTTDNINASLLTTKITTPNGTEFCCNTVSMYMSDTMAKTNLDCNYAQSSFNLRDNLYKDFATLIYEGVKQESGGIEGVSNQEDATLPDTSDWNDLASTLASLQQQYPDAFNNAMVWNTDSPYDDTTGTQTTYVPVPFPSITSADDPQPVSGPQAQSTLSLNDYPQTLVDILTNIIQQQTATQTATPPSNPVDVGIGDTPLPIAPVGNASALWSVYHPTQAQVNSFGAWLWGSPFLTNIGKLFQNPIDGVISLHKIFAMPVDSGTGNIVVGTLDSGVSSATVNQQYVTVDCGSVNCMEDFGNVFDYSPFTSVSIYLPFIGIVPIDVNDVMRSTVHVTYGVDVYTGACLAMVEVTRDAHTVNMYQYAGVASVEYPLSNVQNGQLVSGLLAIGAGVASMVATGGVTAPAVGAVAGGVAAGAKSNVGKSGGFSGNAGAMGIKKPYLILQRPQTKVAQTFPEIEGYPTNYSCKLGDCSNQVVVKSVHVEGIPATDAELTQIESLLKEGVLI